MSFFSCAREDIAAVLDRDPAAKSGFEVVLLYSGLHALWGYRCTTGCGLTDGNSLPACFRRLHGWSRVSRFILAQKLVDASSWITAWVW